MTSLILNKQKQPIFHFLRKKTNRSVLKTYYTKFLNFLMRKGFKNKYITIFYKLLRLYKKRILSIYFWREKQMNIKLPKKNNLLNFSKFSQLIVDKITLELELKFRKFRKKEILIPVPISPWKGIRLGLSLLLKNTKLRVEKIKRKKTKFLYNLLDELWETQNGLSLTCKNITEFTENVLKNSENFRSTQLFPVKKIKRTVIPKIVLKKSLKEETNKFSLFKENLLKISKYQIFFKKNKSSYVISKESYLLNKTKLNLEKYGRKSTRKRYKHRRKFKRGNTFEILSAKKYLRLNFKMKKHNKWRYRYSLLQEKTILKKYTKNLKI